MSEHHATIEWQHGGTLFTYDTYPRNHVWRFGGGRSGGGVTVAASAAPEYLGSADLVDPEEAFTASLSSCHMLTFLAIAAKKKFVVNEYRDGAVGTLDRNAEGRFAVTKVVLHPEVVFEPGFVPDPDELDRMHENAHRHCFISNSVTTEVILDLERSHVVAG